MKYSKYMKKLELSDWVKGELRQLFETIDQGDKSDVFALIKAACMVKEFAASMKCKVEDLRTAAHT